MPCLLARLPACLQVWVYGVVLPSLQSPGKSLGSGSGSGSGEAGDTGGSKRGDVVDAIAGGIQRGGVQPGMVRPPALVAGEGRWRALCFPIQLNTALARCSGCCLLTPAAAHTGMLAPTAAPAAHPSHPWLQSTWLVAA